MNNAHTLAAQIAETFNLRLAASLRNDARYATFAEDIEVAYLVVNGIFIASIQGSHLFSATGETVDAALAALLSAVERWIALD